MDISNEDLLNNLDDDTVDQVEADEAETEQQEQPNRDERGRFAGKAEQAEQQEQPQREGFVPSGRLREEREAREAAERRYRDAETAWNSRFAALEARFPKAEQPKAPDMFEDPNGFVNHGVRQQVDPIKSEIGQLREFYSQREAVREFGAEKVNAARQALEQGMSARDPEAWGVYNRAMQSMDPYGDIARWHQQKSVYSQIGNDPNAWFGKELEAKLSDPKFAAEVMQKIQSGVQGQPQQERNLINLPPNLRKAPGARSGSEESMDMSNAALIGM